SHPLRMNFPYPQAFTRVNVADTAQHALVQEQRLNAGAPPADTVDKLFLAYLERVGAKSYQFLGQRLFRQIGDASEAPRVDVAQFAAVIQQQANMGVLCAWFFRGARRYLPGHPQMHEQGCRARALAPAHTVASCIRGEPQQHEFSIALDSLDPAARQMLLERHGIVDEIRFAKRD